MTWLARLKAGLAKTRETVRGSLDRLLRHKLDPATFEELEGLLLSADLGVSTVTRVMRRLDDARRLSADGSERHQATGIVKQALMEVLKPSEALSFDRLIDAGPKPFVIMAVGVNGVGKTTTVAKVAQRLRARGRRVLLVAADTFRAAAIEQLGVWADRIGVDVIKHQAGADPSAVVFDGLAAAKSRQADVVLIDTAGRLHTKSNLMEELKKMKRVLARELPGAPHEVLLVLDATVGQNALAQARQFHQAVGVTGLVITKLDGTARGGIVVAIADELKIPVRLIGVGEAVEDLDVFQAEEFVDALLDLA